MNVRVRRPRWFAWICSMLSNEAFAWSVVIAGCTAAAATDLRARRIPNVLTGPLILLGLVWWSWGSGMHGLERSLGGLAIAGLPFVVLWLAGGGGAGDAKLMMAVGAWLGAASALVALIGVAIAGGLLALGYAVYARRAGAALAQALWMTLLLPVALRSSGRLTAGCKVSMVPQPIKVPYGAAILAGTCAACAWTFLLRG